MSRQQDDSMPYERIGISYVEAIREAGGIPILLANVPEPDVWLALDGLVLSGGGDFDPALYHAEPKGTYMKGVSPERDATELALLQAVPPDFPVLGICRGIQALAVAYGGTLIQDVPSARPSPIRHAQEAPRHERTHGVRVDPDSKLGRILGEPHVRVNSFHHQAVDRVPEGFVPVAWADDGLLEGIEHTTRPFCIGVQWHPENLIAHEAHARRLFRALVAAAAGRAAEAS
jgi:putative glutamine amidotransferase